MRCLPVQLEFIFNVPVIKPVTAMDETIGFEPEYTGDIGHDDQFGTMLFEYIQKFAGGAPPSTLPDIHFHSRESRNPVPE